MVECFASILNSLSLIFPFHKHLPPTFCVWQITYDYKFEREDGQLSCHCGADVCYGSMN